METTARKVFGARLVIGLAQGLALYLLYSAFDHKTWPATAPDIFAPLVMVALYVPLIVLQGLGNLRIRILAIWTVAAIVLLAGLAFYDIWRAWPGAHATLTAQAFFVCAIFLFVAHALISCGDADRRIIAQYTTLFDLAWKLGVQIAIAACFVGSFWLMVWLGIALFDMIKLTGFQKFIEHPWVWIPLTTLATAVSIHITDTRANLVRGVRTLALTLLGWLLPVIALISFAFLISLMTTGLEPLFQTRHATFLLMAAAAVLVIHINAVYQDGNPDQRPHHILRVAGTLAAVLLVFIVTIAAYALWLRVNQYGWTADRITSAAAVLIGGMFAIGYLIAAILPGLWLKLIERWNVYGTFLFLIVLLALSTPIADPARLSVADQMARLNAGLVKADKFDFRYLRWQGGRFGRDALLALKASTDPASAKAAEIALASKFWFSPPKFSSRGLKIAVYPHGRTMPPSFLKQDWDAVRMPGLGNYWGCSNMASVPGGHCEAMLSDVDKDGQEEILLLSGGELPVPVWYGSVFKEANGHWRAVSSFTLCRKDHDALIAGQYEMVPAESSRDLMVAGKRIHVTPLYEEPVCK